MPTVFEVAVAGDGSILASGILPDGYIFNVHSGLGATRLGEMLQVDLGSRVLFPLSAHLRLVRDVSNGGNY